MPVSDIGYKNNLGPTLVEVARSGEYATIGVVAEEIQVRDCSITRNVLEATRNGATEKEESTMKERTTQVLLIAVCVLLAAHLIRPIVMPVFAQKGDGGPVSEVLRARSIELVNQEGKVVAQLHVGDDGGGNIRLRSGNGMVRAKFGATAEGSGLLLFDTEAEPSVCLRAGKAGTSVTLAEKGKEQRVFAP